MNKKSFILYCDNSAYLDTLTDAQAGQLFRAVFAYQCELEYEIPCTVVAALFSVLRVQFERDSAKYEKIVEKRREAGAKGGKQKQANVASASICEQSQANLADNDSVSVNDSVSEINNIKDIIAPSATAPRAVYPKSDAERMYATNQSAGEGLSKHYLPVKSKGNTDVCFLKQEQVDCWIGIYGEPMFIEQLKKAFSWCVANPGRQKTQSGMGKFFNSWLEKAQNSGGGKNSHESQLSAWREKYGEVL